MTPLADPVQSARASRTWTADRELVDIAFALIVEDLSDLATPHPPHRPDSDDDDAPARTRPDPTGSPSATRGLRRLLPTQRSPPVRSE